MKTTSGRLTSGAAVTILSLATITACGASPGEGSGVAEYKVAAYLDYSGPFANRGKTNESMAKIWIDNFNRTDGQKLKVKLTLAPFDSAYSPAKVTEVQRRVSQDDSVIGILGFGSPTVLGSQEQLAKDKIPMVQSGSSYSFMNKPGWAFGPLGDPGSSWATGITWYHENVAKTSGKMRVALVSFDGSSGKDFVTSTGAVLAGSENIVLKEFVPPTATDVGINVDRVIAAKPDVVVIGTTDGLQPQLLGELKKRGFDMGKILTAQHESLNQMVNLKVPNDTLEGVYEYTTLETNNHDSEAYKIYTANASKFGSPPWNGGTTQISVGMITLTEAIAKAAETKGSNTLTGEDVYKALDAGTFEPLGLAGTITFDPKDRRAGATTGVVYQFKNGAISLVADDIPLAGTTK